jgi:ABC-type sugar transport system ATPase subunit
MRVELAQLHARLGATMIYVTHDQVEAMTLADQIVVLNKGIIEQVGSPMELYLRPRTLFVAGFIGSPRMNLVSGAAAQTFNATTVGIRPEHLDVCENAGDGDWQGKVLLAERLGSDTFLHIDVPEIGRIIARAAGEASFAAQHTVGLSLRHELLHRFDASGIAIRI